MMELGFEPRFDPDFVSSHNASSETTNCFSLSLNLFRLYASFMKPPSNNPDLCTLHALNFCRATALPSHPQLHSIIPLVSSRHHTLCQLEVLFCLAITLICLPKKGKSMAYKYLLWSEHYARSFNCKISWKKKISLPYYYSSFTFCIISWTRL